MLFFLVEIEAEVCGQFITNVETNEDGMRRKFAIFSKDVLNREILVMYEIDSPEDLEYQKDAYGLPLPSRTRSSLPAYVVPRTKSLPLKQNLAKREIGVYRTAEMPTSFNHTLRELCSTDVNNTSQSWSHSPCPHSPPTKRSKLRIIQPATTPIKEEPSSPNTFQPPTPTIGFIETSWSLRTTSTPPPYPRMDNRRRPRDVAYVDEQLLPVLTRQASLPRQETVISRTELEDTLPYSSFQETVNRAFQHPSHHDAELPSNPWYVVHAGARDTDAESGRKRPRPNPPIALEAGRRTTFPVNNPTNMSKIVRTELVIEQTRKEGKR